MKESIFHTDKVQNDARQVGGVNPVPIDLDANSVIIDEHFVHMAPRFGVRVGVFHFVPTEELEITQSERDSFHGIERVVMNVYDYVQENFLPDERVQVEVLSDNFTLGSVTSALVQVSTADPNIRGSMSFI